MLQRADRDLQGMGLVDQFDNPFMHEAFVHAGDGRVTAGPVRAVASDGYHLAYELRRPAFALKLRVATFWAHGYAPVGASFLASSDQYQRCEGAFHVVLDEMVATSGADIFVWPYFPVESKERLWLETWLKSRRGAKTGGRVLTIRHHERAFLDCRSAKSVNNGPPAGMELSRNKRKTMGRQSRRLSELGSVRYLSTLEGLDHGAAIEAFLKTEASGWKAQKGTALAVNQTLHKFVDDFLPQMLADGSAQIDLMLLDDHCLSGLVSFRAGRGLFTWKTGMDEVFKRFSPGVHILHKVSTNAIADPTLDYVDSLADQGHPVAEHLWAGRRQYGQLVIPLTTTGILAARPLAAAFVGKDQARYWIRKVLGRG